MKECKIRNDWTLDEVQEIYTLPLMELVFRATEVHRSNHPIGQIQVCQLLSIKTGACSEDCSYCSQSSRYETEVKVEKLMPPEEVYSLAKTAKEAGATRFCMGAAWREVKDNADFEKVLAMVRSVRSLGLEVCTTLGMVDGKQAERLKEAGLTSYNHNIDTSKDYYKEVISTRTYEDRLRTLKNIQEAGITICSGGIIGMGESELDRMKMLQALANLEVHPGSVPINALVPIKGTPMEGKPRVSVFEMVRMIATARILMPKSKVRLSAGRVLMNETEQGLCFIAGANSIFSGDKLLTTQNTALDQDARIFQIWGLSPMTADPVAVEGRAQEVFA
jgi:biotin synthase